MITNTNDTFNSTKMTYLFTNNTIIKNNFFDTLFNPLISETAEISILYYKHYIIVEINKLDETEKIKCQHLIVYMNKFINIILKKEINQELTIKELTKIFSPINNYLNLTNEEFNIFIRHTITINANINSIFSFFNPIPKLYNNNFIKIMQQLLGNNYKNSAIWNNVPQSNRIIELFNEDDISMISVFIEINKLIIDKLNSNNPSNLRNINLKTYYKNQFVNHDRDKQIIESLISKLNKSKTKFFDFYFTKDKNIKILKGEQPDNNYVEMINKNNKQIKLHLYDPISMENCIFENYKNYFILKQPESNNNKSYYHTIKDMYKDKNDFLNKLNHKHPINRETISHLNIFTIIEFFNYIYEE